MNRLSTTNHTLGAQGPCVFPIGIGLAAIGRPGYINLGRDKDLPDRSPDQLQAHASSILDTALSLGINYFDTARSYGKAESFLGDWLAKRQPSSAVIGSKWGYAYTADWQITADIHEQKEHSLTRFQQQWQESQLTLNHPIDLYQIHSATFESGVLDNLTVLTAMSKLKAQGTRIGLSVSGPRQREIIETAIDIEIDGERLFNSVQATWNMLERSAGPALARAHDAGLAVIIKEAMANGILAVNAPTTKHPIELEPFYQFAKQQQVSLDAVAIAAVLANPWVDVVLSGAATEKQLHSNMKALSIDAHDVLNACAAQSPENYWSNRGALAWN